MKGSKKLPAITTTTMKNIITTTAKIDYADFKRILDSIVKWSFDGWVIERKEAAKYIDISECFRLAVVKWDGHMPYDMRATVKMNLYSIAYDQYLKD